MSREQGAGRQEQGAGREAGRREGYMPASTPRDIIGLQSVDFKIELGEFKLAASDWSSMKSFPIFT